jgi:hypothetical protein
MPIPNSIPHRSLHFSRDATRHGIQHVTIIIIAVSVSVSSVIVMLLCWYILSRSSRSHRSAPLPPRQALVHQREQQLAAFAEYQNVPQIFLDGPPSAPGRHSSNASLIPHVDNLTGNNSYRVSFCADATEGVSTSHVNPLHRPIPRFSAPHNTSSTSLPSSIDHLSEPAPLAAKRSTSVSPNHSQRRPNPRLQPRPFSMVSTTTSHTCMTTHSRSSMRGAPHAPHVNVQIVLPAPLAPNLYPPVVDEHGRRSLVGEAAYSDSWRSSLADKWISVGQQDNLKPKSVRRQRSHEPMERRGRHAQSERVFCCSGPLHGTNSIPEEASLVPITQRRSNSNPPTPSQLGLFTRRSLDNGLANTPPVPRMPATYVKHPKQDAPVPSERQLPPSSLPNSHPVG